ncbi:MAG: CoA-binding protein [Candidatus Jordarchaeaceae archaeon]
MKSSVVEEFRKLFYADSVAVIGATSDFTKLGFYAMHSMLNYSGKVFLVNPRFKELEGRKVYPSIMDVPESVDLAVIVVPAGMILNVLRECAKKGVKGASIITALFKEIGPEGEKLQNEMASIANDAGIKIIGPNTIGFANVHRGLNASFNPLFGFLKKGNIAVFCQSGGISSILANMALDENIGISKIASLGNRVNVDFPDILEYLLYDDETDVIALHIEGLDDARAFMEIAKKVVREKPVVVYKVGRTDINRAAYSHTGSLAGNYNLYSAMFKQVGVISVDNPIELLDAAKALALQPVPTGNRVAILTQQAGAGLVLCDVCAINGLTVPSFTEKTSKKLEEFLPPYTIRTNPIDLAFAPFPWGRVEAARLALEDENIDALIYFQLYFPMMGFPSEELIKFKKEYGKPIIVVLNGPKNLMSEDVAKLEKGGIPVYPTPERGAKALSYLAQYGQILRRLSSFER